MIAANAQPIIDVRKRGQKPSSLILVSLVGRINEANHTVYASQHKQYDWFWVRGLKLCVFAEEGSKWQDTLMAIARNNPEWLAIWDCDRNEGADVCALPYFSDIDKPASEWRWALDFLPWMKCENEGFQCN